MERSRTDAGSHPPAVPGEPGASGKPSNPGKPGQPGKRGGRGELAERGEAGERAELGERGKLAEPGEPAGPGGLPLPMLPGFREMAVRRMSAERLRLVHELTEQRRSAGLSQTE